MELHLLKWMEQINVKILYTLNLTFKLFITLNMERKLRILLHLLVRIILFNKKIQICLNNVIILNNLALKSNKK